ncbi:MAG: hypothetical protein JWM27_3406 [Gemmatimonadetes bacterium]|nr:hypothetical protein [Gemmatimonadota bacterium]
MTGVVGYARTVLAGGTWRPDRLDAFGDEVLRFHDVLRLLADDLESEPEPAGDAFRRLLQGPLADVMTHAGQLALLRRLAGSPVPPENFMLADVGAHNLGPDQPPPAAPKPGWAPDQPPPAPGRRLTQGG